MSAIYDLAKFHCRTLKHRTAFFGLLATVLLSSFSVEAQMYLPPEFVRVDFNVEVQGPGINRLPKAKIDRALLAAYQLFARQRNATFDRSAALKKMAQDLDLRLEEILAAEVIFRTEKGRILWTPESWKAIQLEIGFRLDDFSRFDAYTAILSLVDIEKIEGLGVSDEAFKVATSKIQSAIQVMFEQQHYRATDRWSLLAQYSRLPHHDSVFKVLADDWVRDLLKVVDSGALAKKNLDLELGKFLSQFSYERQVYLILRVVKAESEWSALWSGAARKRNAKNSEQLQEKLGQSLAMLLRNNPDQIESAVKAFENLQNGTHKVYLILKPSIAIMKKHLQDRGEIARLETILTKSIGAVMTNGRLSVEDNPKGAINYAQNLAERWQALISLNENPNQVSQLAAQTLNSILRATVPMPYEVQARDIVLVEMLKSVQSAELFNVVMRFAHADTRWSATTDGFRAALRAKMIGEKSALQPHLSEILTALSRAQSGTEKLTTLSFIISVQELYRDGGELQKKFEDVIVNRSANILIKAAQSEESEDVRDGLKLLDQVAFLLPRAEFNSLLTQVKKQVVEDITTRFKSYRPYDVAGSANEESKKIAFELETSEVYQKALRYTQAQISDLKVQDERALPDFCSSLLQGR